MDATGILANTTGGNATLGANDLCIGQALHAARLRAGLELSQVSADLKICTDYLQAIENMDRTALPHRAYALGFVRCYASYLGLNPQSSVDKFEAGDCADITSHRDISVKPTPFWLDFALPKRAGISIALIGMLGLAAWFGQRNETVPHIVPPVPEMLRTWSESNDLQNAPSIVVEPVNSARAQPLGG